MTNKKRKWYPRCTNTGKIRYPNLKIAHAVLEKFMLTGKPDPGMRAYRCESCYGFHLGSTMRSLARFLSEGN